MHSRVLKEILATDSLRTAVIRERADGVVEVLIFAWNNDQVPGFGQVIHPFWEHVSGPSLTDTLERAEQIAAEALHLGHW